MNDEIEILISCLEKIHQDTDGSCPICDQPDYPVNGEKSGYDEVLPEDAEEYHCDHTADCAVTAIEKFITAWNTHPLEQEIADLKQQLAENLKIWSDLNQENLNCEDENANLRKQLAEAKKKCKDLLDERDNGDMVIVKLEKQLAEAKKKCDEYHNQYHLCEAKLLSHKAIIKQLTVDVNSAFRDGERITVARLDRKLAKAKAENKGIKEWINEFRDSNNSLENELSLTRGRLVGTCKQLAARDATIAALRGALEKIQDHEEAMCEQMAELALEESTAKRWRDRATNKTSYVLKIITKALSDTPPASPWISVEKVCLCGSTRFTAEMLVLQWELTKQGKVVLSWCALPDSYFKGEDKSHVGDQEGVKEIVDEVHLRKIDIADSVFVLNIDGYIGESTRNEINYALKTNTPVSYLETIPPLPERKE